MDLTVALVVLGASTLAACNAGPQRIGAQPSWRETSASASAAIVSPVTFAPVGESAATYNGPAGSPPHTPLGDAVVAAVIDAANQAGIPPPAADARLFRACSDLASIVPDEGIVDYPLVEFAMQRNGIIEPSPHLLVMWGDTSSPQAIVEQLRPRLGELLREGPADRIGIGVAARGRGLAGTVVLAVQSSGISTAPVPRMIPAGGNAIIDAVVDPRYRAPEVFVTREDGTTQQLALRPRSAGESGGKSSQPDPGFFAQVGCANHTGRQQIEITASDTTGSTVLANFPVWCGVAPPATITVDPARDDVQAASTEAAERGLFADLNRDRIAAGLAPLAWDDRLASVARRYAQEMQRTRVVAHISPTSGSASDRVHAAGIKTGLVLENLARAYSVTEAHEGLMNSPGHRANLMSTAATNIGIGVVFGEQVSGRREMFISQVFMRVPPKIEPGKVAAIVRGKLIAARPAMTYQRELDAVAQEIADEVARGTPDDQAWTKASAKLGDIGRSFLRVGSVITATADVDTIDGASLAGSDTTASFGVGVAQGPHPEIGDNAIWIVALIAERR